VLVTWLATESIQVTAPALPDWLMARIFRADPPDPSAAELKPQRESDPVLVVRNQHAIAAGLAGSAKGTVAYAVAATTNCECAPGCVEGAQPSPVPRPAIVAW
jgi:hypothetical protein